MTNHSFDYIIPSDGEAESPQINLAIDAESDVTLKQDTAVMMLSLPQACALHQALGQALVRHARSWGAVSSRLQVVS